MTFNDFEEYKRQGEPDKKQKAENWGIAIGLQQVDGLTPSEYLIQTAKENIEGKITLKEVQQRIDTYYKIDGVKTQEPRKEEADKVSVHISNILADYSFTFAPTTLFLIHKQLFFDIFPKIAGKVRDYTITKDEIVLNGDTVRYGTPASIKETLDYDFDREKKFDYKELSEREKVERIAEFISAIWQTHPFGEGNTRTIAIFTIKYLRAMGFEANNEFFENNAKYFRDTLVRANYQNLKQNISYTKTYLNKFFGNLLLGESNGLDSQDLIIGTVNQEIGTVNQEIGTANDTVSEQILSLVSVNSKITIDKIVLAVKKSRRTVIRRTNELKEQKKLMRVGSDKMGYWVVLVEKDK